ncbi:ACT domain-containing protein [bacterium]|nr:ACT domain-containing protein [bacterium]
MRVKQISIFIENRSGRLREVTEVLGGNGINIRALSLADTSDYGILRLIVDRPDKALEVLKQANFTLSETDVIAVEVKDKPGGLSDVLAILGNAGINVEYMYAFVEKSSNNAVVIFRIEDIDAAVSALKKNDVTILDNKQVTKI